MIETKNALPGGKPWAGKSGAGVKVTVAGAPLPDVATSAAPDAAAPAKAGPPAIPPPEDGYAVYLFPAAVEALGGIVQPYLSHPGGEPCLQCREVDTGGVLIEMTLAIENPEGGPLEVELMLPANMVRMIVTLKHDGRFGFGRKAEVALL
ncbi:hypothetical protein EBB59_02405 [Lysobacter pythonis]|uniref:Uncharacterized protein n=1 Tax=Solilutibacter pythonis TaxID=2483112 RepID=A0A3M2I5N5_9GAMM|nr:hypothetical protein [Lysobacter pythonis]RMH94542.1 hypothetical protein EBB59_02405 [Lysobacter pythonis]